MSVSGGGSEGDSGGGGDSGGDSGGGASPVVDPGADTNADIHTLASTHYENFSVLSRLVPRRLRTDFAAVYAFCRRADDLADEQGADADSRERALTLLTSFRNTLDQSLSTPDPDAIPDPAFRALSHTIRNHKLSPHPFHQLLDAFEQDQRITRYDSWPQLLHYCERSANPVGRIVLALLGHSDGSGSSSNPEEQQRIAHSDAVCTALQLTNFWQDVRRDLLERDRVYMPLEDAGLTPEDLHDLLAREHDPEARIRFIKALRPLVERTWPLFNSARDLPATLAPDVAPIVWLFAAGGKSVLRAVERSGCATLWNRPTLTPARKASLVLVASTRLWRLAP